MRSVSVSQVNSSTPSHAVAKKMAGRLLLLFSASAFILLLSVAAINGGRGRSARSSPSAALQLDVGKLVIDTDAGSDDALGILVALGHERLYAGAKVIAVTCVHGNTVLDNVVVNVLKTLDTAERLDIPVYRGADKSLILTPDVDFFFGQDGFGDFEYPNPPSPEEYLQEQHAANALVDIVTASPGEVTILCMGPLTNIALAIRLDPLFLTKVHQLIILGGSVEGFGNVLPGIEFNFHVDPEATFIVFNSTDVSIDNIKPIILLPWESVAKRHLIPMDWRKNVLGKLDSPQMTLLNKAEAPVLTDPNWVAGDGLIAAIAVNASIVTSTLQEYLLSVPHVDNTFARGVVFVDYQNSLNRLKNVIIIKDINVDNYQNMLLEVLA